MVLKKLFMFSSWLCGLFKHSRARPEILTEQPHQGYCTLNALRWPNNACRLTATGWSHGSSLTLRRPCALTSNSWSFTEQRNTDQLLLRVREVREACPHWGSRKTTEFTIPQRPGGGARGRSLVWGLLLEGCYQYVEGSINGWRESQW